MTTKQKDKLDKIEQIMRDNATGIAALYAAMKAIDKAAGVSALCGIINYLDEKLGKEHIKLATLRDNEDNYKMGIITTAQYQEVKETNS